MTRSPADQLAYLCRGCQNIFNPDELLAKLAEGRPLNVKLGWIRRRRISISVTAWSCRS